MTKENEKAKKSRDSQLKVSRERSGSGNRSYINISTISNTPLLSTATDLVRNGRTNTNSTQESQNVNDNLPISNSFLEDPTDSEFEEETNSFNKSNFKNNKSKNCEPVRHLFTIDSTSTVGYCASCKTQIKMTGRSDANLRTHLASKHNMVNVLLPSQLSRRRGQDPTVSKISRNEKVIIDDELINCTIRDARTFNDFHKPGMRKFLNFIKPGYKPCSRNKIRENLKTK